MPRPEHIHPQLTLESILQAHHKAAVVQRFAACGFDNVPETLEDFEATAELIYQDASQPEVNWRDVVYDGPWSAGTRLKPIYPVNLLGAKGISLIEQSTGFDENEDGTTVWGKLFAPVRSLSVVLNKNISSGKQPLANDDPNRLRLLLAPDMPIAAIYEQDYDDIESMGEKTRVDIISVIRDIQKEYGPDAISYLNNKEIDGLIKALGKATFAMAINL